LRRDTSSGQGREEHQQRSWVAEGERAYRDDATETLENLAIIATVQELLYLAAIQGSRGCSGAASCGGRIEGELTG